MTKPGPDHIVRNLYRNQRCKWILVCVMLAIAGYAISAQGADDDDVLSPSKCGVERYNVVWDSPSKDSSGSMPIGNGDIGLNVWVENTGDLVLLIGKTDSCSENSDLLKLGRVRVKLTPNPFTQGNAFRQELRLRQGEIAITGGSGAQAIHLRIWVDANRPVINVEATGETPFDIDASLELWRTAQRRIDPKSPEMSGYYELRGGPEVVVEPDTILPAEDHRVVWCHRNERSVYPEVLQAQHLESLLDKYPDPLLNRTFGASMGGPGLVNADDRTLKSTKPSTSQRLSITALTAQTATLDQWTGKLRDVVKTVDQVDIDTARADNTKWWESFWDRSWINVSGTPKAEIVSNGYALQRWLEACGGRGTLPMKFNGSIFTVGKAFADPDDKSKQHDVPDWRNWGGSYWFQNTRHLYWPLLPAGDFDEMSPWFAMYMADLPLVTDKTKLYYHHDGACFQETMLFWGTANNANFGWHNDGVETQNNFIKRYWSGGIEMTAIMLDRYDYTEDREFAKSTLVPFANAITTFFDQHWKRGADGKILFDPAQALETWQHAVNPMPEIAGLRSVLPRLIELPEDIRTDDMRARWRKTLADLPPIPAGVNSEGKMVLKAAEKITVPSNSENVELYAVYPYRLYGLVLPDLDIAKRTFEVRRFRAHTCWAPDAIDAALLGLTNDAKADVIANFSNTGARFQAFWKAGHDWIPDCDNGGVGMQALQSMLMQCRGKRILLLPAWPNDWDADFKLHAPYQTTVEGRLHDGKLSDLKVTPESRRADVLIGVAATAPTN